MTIAQAWLGESEKIRHLVAEAIIRHDDAELLSLSERARALLIEQKVATEEDLKWWLASGHRPLATADFRLFPLYMLYKSLLYSFRVDQDEGAEARSAWKVMEGFYDPDFGFFLNLKLDRAALAEPENPVSNAVAEHISYWQTLDGELSDGISALNDFQSACRWVEPSSIARYLATYALLDKASRAPFLPFMDRDWLSEEWLRKVSESIRPYARMFAGLDRCEMSCHWHAMGWTLLPTNAL